MPSGSLAGKAFLVTGGGSGIGAATAAGLVAGGARVVICGRRADSLRRIAHEVGCDWTVADCTIEADVDAALDAAVRTSGRLNGVITCSGTMFSGPIVETSTADWDDCLRSNVTAAFLVVRAALPLLVASRGTVVLISSIGALRSSSGSAAYAAAKAATVSLGQAVAVEHGPDGVRSNVICPGWVRSEMADREMDALGRADRATAYAEITGLVPQRRPGEPAEVAAAAVWLSSEASSYVNGSVLTVDGGTTTVDVGTLPFDFHVTPRNGA